MKQTAQRPADNSAGKQRVTPSAGLMACLTRVAIGLTERGYLPDVVIRYGITALIKSRLRELRADDCEHSSRLTRAFIRAMNKSPIAVDTKAANEQHYELPAAFFAAVLGASKKYSACYWPAGTRGLDHAEQHALRATARRAGLKDGMDILELGCGWGAFTLWAARRYPTAHITAVSNSRSQRRYIVERAREEGLDNITIITADMNSFDTERRFDRVVSIEMFEHMRNHAELLRRIAVWLKDDGRFFMHIFCHRGAPYFFTTETQADWMAKYFFSGGMMPSDDLPLYFQRHLVLVGKWRWSGAHHQKTAEAWLGNMDADKTRVLRLFEKTYGRADARKWWHRWRVFFMACAVLFGYQRGRQWWVSHYLFVKR